MKNNSLSRIVRAVSPMIVGGIFLASGALAMAQPNDREPTRGHCSNRTLLGDYGFQIEGTILGPPDFPLRTLVLGHFNGAGGLTEVDHVVFNGMPPEEEWRQTIGTYSVNRDCTGSASIEVDPGNPPLNYHFVVVDHGEKILLVVDGGAINGVAFRVD